jgi:hypothetical protein
VVSASVEEQKAEDGETLPTAASILFSDLPDN